MKYLLIGQGGQLGWELRRACLTLGEIIAVDYPEVDLADFSGVRDLIRTVKPDILLNPAAYTAVDNAEEEPELVRRVNGIAPGVLAKEMKKLGGALIHYSTDYVFDGKKNTLYNEQDTPLPINVYGRTKLEGEQLVMDAGATYVTFRTSWVYGMRRGGFINKVIQWAQQQKIIHIVDDQFGSPTWARMLAQATAHVLMQGGSNVLDYLQQYRGLYHLAGNGEASRYEWVKTILEHYPGKEDLEVMQILPAKSQDFPSKANRPAYSALDCSKFETTFGIQLPTWQACINLLDN